MEDADLAKYLKIFTFLSLEEIESILAEHSKSPEKRIGQKVLAEHVTTFVHGKDALESAQRSTTTLFENISSLKWKDIQKLIEDDSGGKSLPSLC